GLQGGTELEMRDASDPIRVLVADDHPLLRDGVAAMLDAEAGMTLVGQADSGEQALALFRELRPDVTLMDLRMPGMQGVEAIAAILRGAPAARIIVLTTYPGDVQALQALKAGAA